MANYNYVEIQDIFKAIKALEDESVVTIYTSHGDEIVYSRFYDEYVAVDTEGSHHVCSDMADVIMCSFVRDNMRIKVMDGCKPVWYRWFDLIRINNPRHPWYLGLYAKDDATEIVGKVGFWWDADNVPNGIEYGVHF